MFRPPPRRGPRDPPPLPAPTRGGGERAEPSLDRLRPIALPDEADHAAPRRAIAAIAACSARAASAVASLRAFARRGLCPGVAGRWTRPPASRARISANGAILHRRDDCKRSRRRWSRRGRGGPPPGSLAQYRSPKRSLRAAPDPRFIAAPATPRLSGVAAPAELRATLSTETTALLAACPVISTASGLAARRPRRTPRRRRLNAGQPARDGDRVAAAPAVQRPRRLPRGVDRLAAERLEGGDEDRPPAHATQPSQIRITQLVPAPSRVSRRFPPAGFPLPGES